MPDTYLKQSLPESPADADARARARRALMDAMSRGSRPKARPPVLLAGGVALAAAAVDAAVVWPGGGGVAVSQADAATVARLDAIAAAAARQPRERALRPGTFLYTRTAARWTTTMAGSSPTIYMTPVVRESWIGADGSLSFRHRASGPPVRLAGDGPIPTDMDTTMETGASSQVSERLHQVGLDPATLSAGVTDPEALARRIMEAAPRYGQQPTADEAFTLCGDALRETDLPPPPAPACCAPPPTSPA